MFFLLESLSLHDVSQNDYEQTHQPNRRKVIKYEDYKDDGDYADGHGTHVVGSIIGHKAKDGVNESSGFIDGMAKDAKVSFFDIGLGTACCYVPGQTTLFSGGYSAGSKFHSASWGATTSQYNSNSRGFDNFAYNNKDFLPFVAAGNSGSGNALGTVGAPATAKNIISVGASESDGRDLYGGSDGLNYLAYFSSRGPTSDGRRKPDIVSPGHAILSAKSVPSQSGECEPDNASQLPNAGGSSSYAVSYKSGTCKYGYWFLYSFKMVCLGVSFHRFIYIDHKLLHTLTHSQITIYCYFALS